MSVIEITIDCEPNIDEIVADKLSQQQYKELYQQLSLYFIQAVPDQNVIVKDQILLDYIKASHMNNFESNVSIQQKTHLKLFGLESSEEQKVNQHIRLILNKTQDLHQMLNELGHIPDGFDNIKVYELIVKACLEINFSDLYKDVLLTFPPDLCKEILLQVYTEYFEMNCFIDQDLMDLFGVLYAQLVAKMSQFVGPQFLIVVFGKLTQNIFLCDDLFEDGSQMSYNFKYAIAFLIQLKKTDPILEEIYNVFIDLCNLYLVDSRSQSYIQFKIQQLLKIESNESSNLLSVTATSPVYNAKLIAKSAFCQEFENIFQLVKESSLVEAILETLNIAIDVSSWKCHLDLFYQLFLLAVRRNKLSFYFSSINQMLRKLQFTENFFEVFFDFAVNFMLNKLIDIYDEIFQQLLQFTAKAIIVRKCGLDSIITSIISTLSPQESVALEQLLKQMILVVLQQLIEEYDFGEKIQNIIHLCIYCNNIELIPFLNTDQSIVQMYKQQQFSCFAENDSNPRMLMNELEQEIVAVFLCLFEQQNAGIDQLINSAPYNNPQQYFETIFNNIKAPFLMMSVFPFIPQIDTSGFCANHLEHLKYRADMEKCFVCNLSDKTVDHVCTVLFIQECLKMHFSKEDFVIVFKHFRKILDLEKLYKFIQNSKNSCMLEWLIDDQIMKYIVSQGLTV